MITIEEVRRAIEKYQKEHQLHFGTMIDVTTISSKEGADIISQTVEKISKKVEEDTELWCICEMAKMYMQGVKPVYPVRAQGKWIEENSEVGAMNIKYTWYKCSECGFEHSLSIPKNFCPNCGADMRGNSDV